MRQFGIDCVLIVDDDKDARKLIKIILKSLRGVELVESDCGPSALEIVNKRKLKTIIADIKMDGMDGIEFISAVRVRGFDTPVIFISGHADKELAIKALRLGAFDFVEKKFQNELLLPSVERALSTEDLGLLPKLQSLNLNSTQVKILEMLMKGLTNKEIAEIVNLSEQGVKYHIGNLFKRFGTTDRGELRGKIWGMVSL